MLISLDNVTFGYAGVPVAEDVTFQIHEKERVGFIGANGAGKTTVIGLMLGVPMVIFGGGLMLKSIF